MCKKITLKNDGQYMIFDTSCAHSVSQTEQDGVRVIYSFATEYQIKEHFGKNHIELMNLYKERKIKNESRNSRIRKES
jgi:hypothetical protein